MPVLFKIEERGYNAYHPMNLLRVNMAAMGRVLVKVPIMSPELSFVVGAT
jgi:hypothetical protein